jgi:hypothetical protein
VIAKFAAVLPELVAIAAVIELHINSLADVCLAVDQDGIFGLTEAQRRPAPRSASLACHRSEDPLRRSGEAAGVLCRLAHRCAWNGPFSSGSGPVDRRGCHVLLAARMPGTAISSELIE